MQRRKVWDPENQNPTQQSSSLVSVEVMCISQWQSNLSTPELAVLGAWARSSRIKCRPSKIWCALAFWNVTVGHLTELFAYLEIIKDICTENQANKKWRNFREKRKLFYKYNVNSIKQTQCADKYYWFSQKFRCEYIGKIRKQKGMVVVVMQTDMTFNCNMWNK